MTSVLVSEGKRRRPWEGKTQKEIGVRQPQGRDPGDGRQPPTLRTEAANRHSFRGSRRNQP